MRERDLRGGEEDKSVCLDVMLSWFGVNLPERITKEEQKKIERDGNERKRRK